MKTWLCVGVHAESGEVIVVSHKTPRAATINGRDLVNAGVWRSFRVARVTAAYTRGAVRL